MSADPGLRFWLEVVQREGGLVEQGPEAALALLPAELARTFGVPPEVQVTADPEVAEEEGALLLLPGHPALEAAASRVLERGDVGTGWLPWPRSAPPDAGTLLARARADIPVEHGRIDLAGDPSPVYHPVLRVGALVAYEADEPVEEYEEVWVDARAGYALGEQAARLQAQVAEPAPLAVHPVLAGDLPVALRAAAAALRDRAAARGGQLERAAQVALRAEAARAEAYYADVLESIARRRETAAPDRQALLDAQAEATRSERARRLQEIADKARVRSAVRPVRLHLRLVPALLLPVWVRRGELRYPLALTWLLPAAAFAAVPCPHCGSAGDLIAGRERLGCARCLQPRSRSETTTTTAPAASPEPAAAPAAPAVPAPPPASPPPTLPPAAGSEAAAAREPASPRAARAVRTLTARERKRFEEVNAELAVRFWTAALEGTVWPRAELERGSPLEVLYELLGPGGPLVALGLDPALPPPGGFTSATARTGPGLDFGTSGMLHCGAAQVPFTLRWRLGATGAVLEEILPFERAFGPWLPALNVLPEDTRARLTVHVPPPRSALDPVAQVLWRDLPALGLPLVLRCLAAWGRARARPEVAALAPGLAAAAVARLVGERSGVRGARSALAKRFGVPTAGLGAAEALLEPLLGLTSERPW